MSLKTEKALTERNKLATNQCIIWRRRNLKSDHSVTEKKKEVLTFKTLREEDTMEIGLVNKKPFSKIVKT